MSDKCYKEYMTILFNCHSVNAVSMELFMIHHISFKFRMRLACKITAINVIISDTRHYKYDI